MYDRHFSQPENGIIFVVQVLQDALCGSSKVMLVCNISPEAVSSSETLSSLNFALRASQVSLQYRLSRAVFVRDGMLFYAPGLQGTRSHKVHAFTHRSSLGKHASS